MGKDVSFLAAAVNEKRRKLYRSDGTPWYADDIMRERLAEIDKYELDGLRGIVATHTERAELAAAELHEKSNPYKWLHGDEWTQAAAMSQFIAADLAGLPDAKSVAGYVEDAAGAGRVVGWLVHWHGRRRLADLEGDFFRPQAEKALETAADQLLTAAERDARRKATEDIKDARQQIEAAERVLDAPHAADRLGLPGYAATVRQQEGFEV